MARRIGLVGRGRRRRGKCRGGCGRAGGIGLDRGRCAGHAQAEFADRIFDLGQLGLVQEAGKLLDEVGKLLEVILIDLMKTLEFGEFVLMV